MNLVRSFVIYSMIIPITVLYVWLIIYHKIFYKAKCLPEVNRKDYFRFDRHVLDHLSLHDKIGCWYCDYFNGVLGYGTDLAGYTEERFCPIKNNPERKNPHKQYHKFKEYK